VKLTQGTGRGTCWWSIKTFFFSNFFLMETYTFITLNDFFELGLQNISLSNKKSFTDFLINIKSSTLFSSNFIIEYFNNLILIFFFYYILKLIILSSIVELL